MIRSAALLATALCVATAHAADYTSLGCFNDNENGQRVYPVFFCSTFGANSNHCASRNNAKDDLAQGYAGYYGMTHLVCNGMCQGYSYFGVENGSECYCGNNPNPPQGRAHPRSCNVPCSGNVSQVCGGPSQLSVFKTNSGASPLQGTLKSRTPLGSAEDGTCFVDAPPQRVLPTFYCSPHGLNPNNPQPACLQQPNLPEGVNFGYAGFHNMTHEVCNTYCQGYAYFGVENAGECYCGQDFPSYSPSDGCDIPCYGNSSQNCGGGMRIRVFKTTKLPQPLFACVANRCQVTASPKGVDLETCKSACGHGSYACENDKCVPSSGGVNITTCQAICRPK